MSPHYLAILVVAWLIITVVLCQKEITRQGLAIKDLLEREDVEMTRIFQDTKINPECLEVAAHVHVVNLHSELWNGSQDFVRETTLKTIERARQKKLWPNKLNCVYVAPMLTFPVGRVMIFQTAGMTSHGLPAFTISAECLQKSKEFVEDTIIHEMAHVICEAEAGDPWFRHSHCVRWQRVNSELGGGNYVKGKIAWLT